MDVVHGPCVAVCEVVEVGLAVGVVDDVFGVQHVEDLQLRQCLFHLFGGLHASESVEVTGKILRDDVLVTAQLHATIAAQGLVEIAGAGVVEHVFRDVGHAEAQCLVVQDELVGGGCCKGHVELTFVNEVVVVEVALVDGEHVDQYQSREDGKSNLAFQFAFAIKEKRHGSQDDEDQAAHGVLAEDGHAHVGQPVFKDFLVEGRALAAEIAEYLRVVLLVGDASEAEE